MSRNIAWIALGLVLGSVITVMVRHSNDLAGDDEGATINRGDIVAGPSPREFEGLLTRVGRLESRLDELVSELRTEVEQSDIVASDLAGPDASPAARSEGIAARLLAGGFTPDRAQRIEQRSEELLMAQIAARYEAEREGEPLAMEALERLGPQYALREELGDWEYERYLQALGQPTSVGIVSVLENSPAARAGLMAGDQIVSYGGTRVFNVLEVTQLTRQGTVGESVIVDIVRDAQPMQIVVPRGPLGAALAGNGLPGAVVLPSAQNQ